MAMGQYSSRFLTASYLGVNLDGFAPDSSITLTRNSSLKEMEVGADGQTMMSILPDRSGTATLSFQQASKSNVILSGFVNYEEANDIPLIGSMTITSPDGSVLAVLRGVTIMTTPEMALGSSANGSTRDWEFYAEEMIFQSTPDGFLIPSAQAAQVAAAIDTAVANNLITI